jgi:hypothetical protein
MKPLYGPLREYLIILGERKMTKINKAHTCFCDFLKYCTPLKMESRHSIHLFAAPETASADATMQ